MSEDPLWDAVAEALAPVSNYESDMNKLEKKTREYFRRGAKTLEWHSKSWEMLINDYADNVFGSLFQALGEKDWLSQVDFLLVMDAGIKDSFPPDVLGNVPQQAFERTVLAAHDRAFEEQRYLPILWEAVNSVVTEGKSARKKTYEAADLGRKDAAATTDADAPDQLREFVERWIDASISRLSKTTQGYPETALPEQLAKTLFDELIERGALPLPLVQSIGHVPPKNWFVVKQAVAAAYARYGEGAGEEEAEAPQVAVSGYGARAAKGRGKGLALPPRGGPQYVAVRPPFAVRGAAIKPVGVHPMGQPSGHPMGAIGRGGGKAAKGKGKAQWRPPQPPRAAIRPPHWAQAEEEPWAADGAEADPWGVLEDAGDDEEVAKDEEATDELTAALAELEESLGGEGPPQKRARIRHN